MLPFSEPSARELEFGCALDGIVVRLEDGKRDHLAVGAPAMQSTLAALQIGAGAGRWGHIDWWDRR